jgi:hypothetical protein
MALLNLTDFIRKIAGAVKDEYHAQEIRIFFSAPNPRAPSSESLDMPKNPTQGANFQWLAFRLYFTFTKTDEAEPEYYIYHTSLYPDGKEKLPAKVFKSDSKWSLQNVNIPINTPPMTPGDLKRQFPEILKGPQLFPKTDLPIIYRNSDQSDTKEYADDEFKRLFDNDFYIVINPKSKELKNPFGRLVGKSYPPKEEKPEEGLKC